jgi:outer membrane protein
MNLRYAVLLLLVFAATIAGHTSVVAQTANTTPTNATAGSVGTAVLRIGFVNNEKILRDSPAGLKIATKLEKEFEKRRADLKTTADRIAELQRQIERAGVTMPESDRRVRERELGTLTRDFQRTQRELQEDYDLRANDELRSLAARADRIINRIATTEGFDLIVQKEAVVFVSPRIDLTDRVIKELGE